MSNEQKPKLRLEIAHVLFVDIVGYSKLLIDEQTEALQELNSVVRSAAAVTEAEAANALLRLPTGDGVALVFTQSAEAPVECAMQISEAARSKLELPLRMGIHSGPVNHVEDLGGRENIAGAGINTAQRVMDCGDAGHILLSKRAADDLGQYRQWRPLLHDLGECEVKHGVRLHLVNLHGEGIGNPAIPGKLACAAPAPLPAARSRQAWPWVAAGGVILIGALVFLLLPRFAQRATTKDVTSIPSEASAKSIAVLPFENLSDDKQNAYFAEGMQDEVLTRLAKIADLKVISRTSTQHYKSAPENLPEIARQLGVTNILEGSVQKAGDKVRVNVQLINARNDAHLWAETYDRNLTDIFTVESDIAKSIADQLRAKLSGTEAKSIAAKPTQIPEAYDEYLRGIAIWTQYSMSPLVAGNAAVHFKRAVEIDPNSAAAWAHLSIAYSRIFYSGDDATATRREQARATLDRAVELKPEAAESVMAQGYFAYWVEANFDSAAEIFRHAQQLLPGSADPLVAISYIERRQGKLPEALAHQLHVTEMDPRNPTILTQLSVTYNTMRRFADAQAAVARALEITPDDAQLHSGLARLFYEEGKVDDAVKALQNVPPTPEDSYIFEMQVRIAWLTSRWDDAVQLLEPAIVSAGPSGYRGGYYRSLLGLTQHLMGDTEGAKQTLSEARLKLEEYLRAAPNNPETLLSLSFVYAVLGDKDAAVRNARAGIAARPTAIDHSRGPGGEEMLARVNAWTGATTEALDAVERLLKTNYLGPEQIVLTPSVLQLDPVWQPLRNNPRFAAIVAKAKP